MPYTIDPSPGPRRQAVKGWLHGLDLVSPALAEDIVTAWVTTWSSSPYETLESMPATAEVDYKLTAHVNEVTRAGIDLAHRATVDWGIGFDPDVLLPILILHDVDKPLMYEREGGRITHSTLYHELQHGVVGAMLLRELGFAHAIVSAVALHAGNAPYHAPGFEAYVLHYADTFSGDHMLMATGRKPTFQP